MNIFIFVINIYFAASTFYYSILLFNNKENILNEIEENDITNKDIMLAVTFLALISFLLLKSSIFLWKYKMLY